MKVISLSEWKQRRSANDSSLPDDLETGTRTVDENVLTQYRSLTAHQPRDPERAELVRLLMGDAE